MTVTVAHTKKRALALLLFYYHHYTTTTTTADIRLCVCARAVMSTTPSKEAHTLVDAEAQRAAEEARRLRERALHIGTVLSCAPQHSSDGSNTFSSDDNAVAASASKARPLLQGADGLDIVKPSRVRKQKYLVLFPGVVSFARASAARDTGGGGGGEGGDVEAPDDAGGETAAAGRPAAEGDGARGAGAPVAVLSSMDTCNPTLCVHLRHGRGRMLFRGTLFYPRNTILACKFPAPASNAAAGGGRRNKSVLVDDIFETVIVFSEWCWAGTREENPHDEPLPLPDDVRDELTPDMMAAMRAAPNATPAARERKSGDAGGDERGESGVEEHHDGVQQQRQQEAVPNGDAPESSVANRVQHSYEAVPVGAFTGVAHVPSTDSSGDGDGDADDNRERDRGECVDPTLCRLVRRVPRARRQPRRECKRAGHDDGVQGRSERAQAHGAASEAEEPRREARRGRQRSGGRGR